MRNRTENQVTLTLIRHGKTRANEEHRYLGKTDEALSENGREALLSFKARGCYPMVSYLFTSPMKRCLETAEILYPNVRPVMIPEWKEMDFGQFEYKNYEELKDDIRYQAWMDSGGTIGFPGGESRGAFVLRCEKGFGKMCKKLFQLSRQNTDVPVQAGIIAHGGTIMALLHSFAGKEYFDSQVSNGEGFLTTLSWYDWHEGAAAESERIQIKVEKKL